MFQMSLPTAATREDEARYAIEVQEKRDARAANIVRRDNVREMAEKAARIAASAARRQVYLENGYRECDRDACSTLVTPGYTTCIPHSGQVVTA